MGIMAMTQEVRLKRAHINLLRHKDTSLYGGVILMGESSVEDDAKRCPTAYTDGYNKRYGRKFMEKLTDEEVAGLVLHENFHVLMKHIPRGRVLRGEDQRLVNIAMDYAVNDLIVELSKVNPNLCKLPSGGLYDPMFKDWSFLKIFEYLKQEQQDGRGGGRGDSMDEHDTSNVDEMTDEQREKLSQDITDAMQQSAILASKLGADIPRAIKDLMDPQVDWREALRDFVTSAMRGDEEYTWRKFNKRRLVDDLYLPSTHSESIGELIVAIDTSGSIGEQEIAEFATELVNICDTASPDRVRVLWWDTKVHGEQIFEAGQFGEIKSLLKPLGGGGTRASCVSEYIVENNVSADCLVVFTDGHLESEITWLVNAPTLWLVTRKRNFVPPSGTVVRVEK